MKSLRISTILIALVIALVALAAPANQAHASPDPPVVTDVRMGEPGDRWLDLMQYRRIERVTMEGVFGYAITYDGSDGDELVFFYPRALIDLAGEKPLSTRVVMDVPGGRVWYPDLLTAASLPRVYKGILWIEGKYRADARGGISAMQAFVLVFGAADAAPVLSTLTARVFSHRASGQGGVAVLEVTGAKGASQAGTKARVTTSTAAPAPASPAAATARQVEKAESAVPATSRIVRPSVAPAKVASGTCGSGGSSRALTAALEKAGHIKPPGAAVHHIVARTAKKAREAREVLQKYGIDMDDAVNGVFLPAARKSPNPASASVHSTLHTDKYYKAVNELLLQANTRAEVVERLARIRARLLAGTMVR